jgi:hypothetical protein
MTIVLLLSACLLRMCLCRADLPTSRTSRTPVSQRVSTTVLSAESRPNCSRFAEIRPLRSASLGKQWLLLQRLLVRAAFKRHLDRANARFCWDSELPIQATISHLLCLEIPSKPACALFLRLALLHTRSHTILTKAQHRPSLSCRLLLLCLSPVWLLDVTH